MEGNPIWGDASFSKQLRWWTVLVFTNSLQTEEEARFKIVNPVLSGLTWRPLAPFPSDAGFDSLSHALFLISRLWLWLSSWALEVGGLFDMWSPGFLPEGVCYCGGFWRRMSLLFCSPASVGCRGSRGIHFLLESSCDFVFLRPAVVFNIAVLFLSSEWQFSDVTAVPPKKHVLYILQMECNPVVFATWEKKKTSSIVAGACGRGALYSSD